MKRLLDKAREKKKKAASRVTLVLSNASSLSRLSPSKVIHADESLVRLQGHVTQTITKIKTKLTDAGTSFVTRLTSSRRQILKRTRLPPKLAQHISSARRFFHKVTSKSKQAAQAIADKINVPQSIAKPLRQFSYLANKFVLSKIPTIKVLDKLKKFAKLFLSRPDASRTSRSQELLERFVRSWVSRVKARLAARDYAARVRAEVTDEVMRLLDTTTSGFVAKLQAAAHRERSNAAQVIQHRWKHAKARWRQREMDQARVVFALRLAGRRLICRHMAESVVASAIKHAKGRLAVRTLQSHWRGRSTRDRLKREARAKRRRREIQRQKKIVQQASPAHRREELLLATLKRVWAREDFIPAMPRKHRHMFSKAARPTLDPIAPRTPPNGHEQHGLHRINMTKWQKLKGHVNPKRCWVAIPIHVHEHAQKATLAPLQSPSQQPSKQQRKYYDLSYDWVPGTLLEDPPSSPLTFQEKVRQLQASGQLKQLAKSQSSLL
ncbi:hypothetical protein LEN26_004213 [Aphanomyces euteiches]|nr:hypothetical protein AeMF1_000705 [Aphanomyces euteiches]KAH9149569.1 hypothetical protein LEN26_004213 [Aphanomyces euteiches]KAH9195557.1 hypothetical protein AeNC1_002474 [Aphanomyces euteiches]